MERIAKPKHATLMFLGIAFASAVIFRLAWLPRENPLAGDSRLYLDLARNWLAHGTLGVNGNGHLLPSGIRMPGYPAVLAAVLYVFSNGIRAAQLLQVALDSFTAVIAGQIAARLVPRPVCRSAAIWTAFVYAVCPFTAQYTAVLLTETAAIFLQTAAMLVAISALLGCDFWRLEPQLLQRSNLLWAMAGALIALLTLFRPEGPLLGIALLPVIGFKHRKSFISLTRTGSLLALGFSCFMFPWVIRNRVVLHRWEVVPPVYLVKDGDVAPLGFYAWTHTWLTHYRDVDLVWHVQNNEPIAAVPSASWSTNEERSTTERLIAEYNESRHLSPALDGRFHALAEQRKRSHRFTTASVPLRRAVTLWTEPRITRDYGNGATYRQRLARVAVVLLALLNILFATAGWYGLWALRHQASALAIASAAVVRTAFLANLEWPEPRYLLVLFPALIAAAAGAAIVFRNRHTTRQTEGGGPARYSGSQRGWRCRAAGDANTQSMQL